MIKLLLIASFLYLVNCQSLEKKDEIRGLKKKYFIEYNYSKDLEIEIENIKNNELVDSYIEFVKEKDYQFYLNYKFNNFEIYDVFLSSNHFYSRKLIFDVKDEIIISKSDLKCLIIKRYNNNLKYDSLLKAYFEVFHCDEEMRHLNVKKLTNNEHFFEYYNADYERESPYKVTRYKVYFEISDNDIDFNLEEVERFEVKDLDVFGKL